jgi:probable phosphoglycerate mutase
VAAYPKRLLLVRHGETEWNREQRAQGLTDVPLNDKGRRQAQALARRLRNHNIDALHSSDLARASETAAILATVLGLPVQLSGAWREIDLGEWAGLNHSEIETRFPEELAALERGKDVPRGGGETLGALRARAAAEFERLAQIHQGQTVLVVSHGGTLKALICHLIGLDIGYQRRLSAGGNTGLSIVEFSAGQPKLTLLNDTSHLES